MKKTITSQKTSFAQWYQDVVREAGLAEPSEVRGCGIVKPYGYEIWELIKTDLDNKIKATGAKTAYFPIFVPLENIQAEVEHLEGFAPELAIVTHGGGEELNQKLAVRPTSETAMYKTYAKWIESYRDLPLRLNQWNNVVRWEKRPRAFLRWSEFLWQEGHSAFASQKEAIEEVWQMLDIYESVYKSMGISVLKGQKSELEKFAGAEMTTTVEIMSKDGKSIQGATSHYLGNNFAKVFNVKYTDQKGIENFVFQTSWGMSWRSIGALIMAHGDDDGLKLPPSLAPIQIVIVPFFKDNNQSLLKEFAHKIKDQLKKYRVELDFRTELSAGAKFNEWEIKGVPIRIEIGDKELNESSITIFRRDNGTKQKFSLNELEKSVTNLVNEISENMYLQTKKYVENNIYPIKSIDEIDNRKGFFLASWSETKESEKLLKEKHSMVSRVQLKEAIGKTPTNAKCFITGKEAKGDWLFAKSY